jgi:hypothetical protein
LRWLMGGSQLDICFAFGVANSTFFQWSRSSLANCHGYWWSIYNEFPTQW